MRDYLVRRLLLSLIVLWGVATFVFFALRVLPGDYAAQQVANTYFAGSGQQQSTKDALAAARKSLGMDGSIPQQYIRFLDQLLRGDFGRSFRSHEASMSVVGKALPYSLQLGAMTTIIALLVALPVGVLSAVRQNTWLDAVTRSTAILGLAAPSFWTATLLTLLVLRFHLLTLDLVHRPGIWTDPWRSIQLFLLPALAGGLASGAILMRMLRSQLLDVMRQEYVRVAWSKGLSERTVVTRHIVRNALLPVVTIFGLILGAMVSGSVILEAMFNIPGMGLGLLNAIQTRDVPVAQAMTIVIAVGLVGINLLVDISYVKLDPRVSFGSVG